MSIHLLQCKWHFIWVVWVEPISAATGHGKWPIYHSANGYRRTNTHMHTSMGNLESPVNLTLCLWSVGESWCTLRDSCKHRKNTKWTSRAKNKRLKVIVAFTYGDWLVVVFIYHLSKKQHLNNLSILFYTCRKWIDYYTNISVYMCIYISDFLQLIPLGIPQWNISPKTVKSAVPHKYPLFVSCKAKYHFTLKSHQWSMWPFCFLLTF